MRLLNVDTFKLEDFFYVDPPPYAILSHTWGNDSEEVSYRDVQDGRLDLDSARPLKMTGCCKQAKSDGYQYVWIDSCCIDKANSVELQEAINSMFRWYRNAAICYAYLSDVPFKVFSSSRWFRRGWTLQELLAPLNLRFYDREWKCMGTKGELCDVVERVTGIPTSFLLGITELHHASVAQRMSWAANRVTKRQEDIAYCLLGIFGVSMPMIYGEGEKAFRRLQEQIMKELEDDSILAWHLESESPGHDSIPDVVFGTVLAPAPSYFANSGQVVVMDHSSHSSFEIHGGSLRLSLAVHTMANGQIVGLLKCGLERDPDRVVAVPLAAAPGGRPNKYVRLEGRRARLVAKPTTRDSRLVHIQLEAGRKSPPQSSEACWFHIRKSVPGLDVVGVHPTPCWHKERALIEAALMPTANGTREILVRFQTEGLSADFVAVLGVDSEARPHYSLMVAARKTTLEDIAGNSVVWKHKVIGNTRADNGTMQLAMALETLQAPSSQRRFVLKPVLVVSDTAPVTFNVTASLRLSGATALLDHVRRIDEQRKQDAERMRKRLENKKQILAGKQTEIKRIRASIKALEEQERQLVAEYERQCGTEAELFEHYGRVESTEVDFRNGVSRLERYINSYTAGDEDSENGDGLSKTAEDFLPFAIQTGYYSLARQFLERVAYFSETGPAGAASLEHAVMRSDEELVRLLLEKGAKACPSDPFVVNPLYIAVERGDEGIARLLIDNGADVRRPSRGETPLHAAVKLGSKRIARLLLRKGAIVTAPNTKGITPLDLARENGSKLWSLLWMYAPEAYRVVHSSPKCEIPKEIPAAEMTLELEAKLFSKKFRISPDDIPAADMEAPLRADRLVPDTTTVNISEDPESEAMAEDLQMFIDEVLPLSAATMNWV